jgi:hypothetical protein
MHKTLQQKEIFMKTLYVSTIAAIVACNLCIAQETTTTTTTTPASVPAEGAVTNPWKIDLNANLTMTMNSYSNNWIGGDAGSVSWASQINGSAEKQFTPKVLNQNKLRLAFGQTMIQNSDSKVWSDLKKSADLIDIESVLKFTLDGWADPYIGVRGISEFVDERDTSLTRYFNPWELSETFGASREIVKKERVSWSARIGLGGRQTIDADKLVEGSLTERKTKVDSDGGAELVSELKVSNKANWLTYTSLLKVFDAFISTKSSETALPDHENDWRYPHMNWEHIVVMNVTKYIMINYYMQLLYDRDLNRDLRFKQTLSLGLTYTYKK